MGPGLLAALSGNEDVYKRQHEGGLPLVDGAGEDPGATVAMPAMPQE